MRESTNKIEMLKGVSCSIPLDMPMCFGFGRSCGKGKMTAVILPKRLGAVPPNGACELLKQPGMTRRIPVMMYGAVMLNPYGSFMPEEVHSFFGRSKKSEPKKTARGSKSVNP